MKIQGTLLYYDVENKNGRVYTKECAEDIVKQFSEFVYPMFGQLGYPDEDNFGRGNLGEISHQIKEIHLNPEEKTIEGTIEILDKTPNGKKLLTLIDNHIEKFNELFVVRSRGVGTTNENKEIVDYKIISFDVVPKSTDAFLLE